MTKKVRKKVTKMTTKEKIIDEALTLFSTKGFKGTSVKNIAEAVGIKDASLYKHFKSKQEILDTVVAMIRQHIGDMSDELGLPDETDLENAAAVYAKFDEETLLQFSRKIFLFYLTDPLISRFWRMGTIEQYQNSEVYALFSKLFLEDSITYQTALFGEMIKQRVFSAADPRVMATSFYSPIFFLLSKYINDTEHENEALEILDGQVREFYRIYHSGQICFRPIGVIQSPYKTLADVPKAGAEAPDAEGEIVVDPVYLEAMADITAGKRYMILFHFHEAEGYSQTVHLRGDGPLTGLFSTHAPCRPNPIGVSSIKVISIDKNVIRFSGVDMLDGTPVLDIKSE